MLLIPAYIHADPISIDTLLLFQWVLKSKSENLKHCAAYSAQDRVSCYRNLDNMLQYTFTPDMKRYMYQSIKTVYLCLNAPLDVVNALIEAEEFATWTCRRGSVQIIDTHAWLILMLMLYPHCRASVCACTERLCVQMKSGKYYKNSTAAYN